MLIKTLTDTELTSKIIPTFKAMATCLEIEVPVPWGKIAGKTYGKESFPPILVIHGIQDNCGSFDRLIPLLPEVFYYVCIDLPGHGMSSHFRPGVPLDFFNYVYSVKLVVDYLKWSKLKIMAHSLGAQITAFFSSLYPDLVESVVLIDGLTPIVIDINRSASHLRSMYDKLQTMEKKLSSKKPPIYTYEEALKKLKNNRATYISNEGAECLIKRSLIPADGGYSFSADQRLKIRLRPTLTIEQMKSILDCMKCKGLMIIAKETFILADSVSEELYHERLSKLFLSNPNFSFLLVEGNHDVHMNNPERIATQIWSFLLRPSKSSL